jgi:hypothetical protein
MRMTSLPFGTNAADRLVEALAGSTALLADPTGGTTDLPLSLTSVLPGSDTNDGTAAPQASGLVDSLPASNVLDTVTSLLGDDTGSTSSGGDLPIVSSLLGTGDLPVVDSLLNGNTSAGSTLTLAGSDGTLQPVLNAANAAILDVHYLMEVLGHEVGLPNTVHGVTNLGETVGLGEIGTPASSGGNTNLVTDALNAPGQILDGNIGGTISNLGADLTNVVNAAAGLVDEVLIGSHLGTDDPTNPIDNLIANLGQDLQSLPLVTLNGGNNASDGGLLGGIVGSLSNPSSGHLVDLDVGPEQPNGQAINVLSAPTSGDHHTVEVNAVDVGANGPHLLDLGLLTGSGGLNIPSLGGTGTDGLSGNVLGGLNLGNLLGGSTASNNTVSAPVTPAVDVNAAIHDLLPVANGHGILDSHGTHIL